MQRKACHKFAESMGWEIVQEEQEAGVSGFKVSAADREAIIKLKEDALKTDLIYFSCSCSTDLAAKRMKHHLLWSGSPPMALRCGA